MDNYQDMPIRAYGVTFVDNTLKRERELPEQVFQGRSIAEAAQAAEVLNLEDLDIPFTDGEPIFNKAWDNHWSGTNCKPKFIVGKIRDLGIIMNQSKETRLWS